MENAKKRRQDERAAEQKHYEALDEFEGFFLRMTILCEGLYTARSCLSDEHYSEIADGVFYLLSKTTDEAYGKATNLCVQYGKQHGLLRHSISRSEHTAEGRTITPHK